jgi:hypothetical protein
MPGWVEDHPHLALHSRLEIGRLASIRLTPFQEFFPGYGISGTSPVSFFAAAQPRLGSF